jgi:hypothetical protein
MVSKNEKSRQPILRNDHNLKGLKNSRWTPIPFARLRFRFLM